MKRLNILRALFFLCLLTAFGCAGHIEEVKKRYFWPPPPNPPKLELINTYSSKNDFPESERQKWLKKVVGESEGGIIFLKPLGIASDGEGKVYITDPNQASVIVYDLKKYKIGMLGEAGNFITPVGIGVDSRGRVYVTDTDRNRNEIYVFDKNGGPLFNFGKGIVNWPTGIAFSDEAGMIYITNSYGHNVTVFDMKGEHLFTFGERGLGEGKFNYPLGIATNSKGEVIVADAMNALIQIFSPRGDFLRQFGRRGMDEMEFQMIKGVAVDTEDHIYVVDGRSHKLSIFTDQGESLLSFGGKVFVPEEEEGIADEGFQLPSGIALDKNNTIYVTDTWNRRFHVYQFLDEAYVKNNPIEAPAAVEEAVQKTDNEAVQKTDNEAVQETDNEAVQETVEEAVEEEM